MAETSEADGLFEKGQWEKAQSAYDAVLAKQGHPLLPVAVRAMERAVLCSLKLQNPEDALRRVMAFHAKVKWRGEEEGYYWPQWEPEKLAIRRADISRLEFLRGLLEKCPRKWGQLRRLSFRGNCQRAASR